ncbi:MAG: OmpA family protein [Bacteroidales bacterium]|nr:OmpA family protein [Bacteroidales bacterium]
MKNNLIPMALAVILLCPVRAYSQKSSHAVELGIGGSAINHTRTMVTNFHQTPGGDYVFTLEEKQLYGGVSLYSAYEIKKWLYADVQGTLGLARYYESGSLKNGFSVLAGPGIQFRPFVRSEWLQPYLRLGVSYYRKSFPTFYFGRFEGDVTKEAVWKAEDAWNKGTTFDAKTYIPVTAGIGLVGWLSDRVGVRVGGDYMRSLGSKGANFAMGTAGLVFRLGGKSKKSQVIMPTEKIVEKVVEKEVVREVPVETIREVYKEVPFEKTLAELMDNVTFDFDKADITKESESVLDEVANVLKKFTDKKFMICGHTDARGSDSYNERLSEARAKAVRDALVKRGVPEDMLFHKGFGRRTALVPASADDNTRRGDRKVVIEQVTWEPLWNYLKTNN